MTSYELDEKIWFHSDGFLIIKGRVENLKLQLDYGSLYLCLLNSVLL